jgi:hypothetical protein
MNAPRPVKKPLQLRRARPTPRNLRIAETTDGESRNWPAWTDQVRFTTSPQPPVQAHRDEPDSPAREVESFEEAATIEVPRSLAQLREYLGGDSRFDASEIADFPDEELAALVAGRMLVNWRKATGEGNADQIERSSRTLSAFMSLTYSGEALVDSMGTIIVLENTGKLRSYTGVEV